MAYAKSCCINNEVEHFLKVFYQDPMIFCELLVRFIKYLFARTSEPCVVREASYFDLTLTKKDDMASHLQREHSLLTATAYKSYRQLNLCMYIVINGGL